MITSAQSPIHSEQEAAVAILFSCVLHDHLEERQNKVEHISRMLMLSSKFEGHSLQELAGKAIPLVNTSGHELVIAHCAPYITESFRETLFAMVCELLTGDGRLSFKESEQVGLAALYLGISIEMMQVMINIFLIRNRYNL